MQRKVRIAIAGIAAGIVGLSFALYAQGVRKEADAARSELLAQYGGEVVELAVANKTLESGEVVSSSDVDMREWLVDLTPEGAYTALDDVVGSTLSAPIASGSPFTSLHLRASSNEADIPSGYVALALSATADLGLPVDIEPGAHVVGYRVENDSSQVVAPNIVVLSVASSSTGLSSSSQSISIAVLPENVADVLSASSSGTLRLVMPAADVESIPDQQTSSTYQEAPSEVLPQSTEQDDEQNSEDE